MKDRMARLISYKGPCNTMMYRMARLICYRGSQNTISEASSSD